VIQNDSTHHFSQRHSMKRALIIFAKILGVIFVIAALAAMAVLVTAQFWPDAANAVITIDDEQIPMVGVFSAGALTLVVAWLLVTIGIIISIFAVVFALFVTAAALLFTALIVGFPFIVGGLIVWLIMRRKHASTSATHGNNDAQSNTLPPPSANAA
jgi:uncharacterized membrane protein